MSDKTKFSIFVICVTVISVTLVFIVPAIVDTRNNTNACEEQAKSLNLEWRYSSGCLFKTSGGVWMPELEYLLVCATNQCP
jgi:hypothetical protein